MRIKEVGYIVERLADRFRDLGGQMAVQEAAHKTALSELSASFNARTASDEHRMENLREEIIRLNDAHGRTMVERDALRTEVAELKRQLKPQTPKHPVKVGDWVRRLVPLPGSDAVTVAEVVRVEDDTSEIEVKRIDGLRVVWFAGNCEHCDPPKATHDTPTGKQVAEAAVRTEPVADEIKVGDVVLPKVWGIGQMTKVTHVLPDGTLLIENSIKTWKVDEVVLVRKVTT